MRKFKGKYPPEWTKELRNQVRAEAGNKCERCGHPHDPQNSYTLTVHHLDNDKSNCARWNLAALCQRCHLHIQGKVFLPQIYMFEHSDWIKPHLVGYYASLGLAISLDTPWGSFPEAMALSKIGEFNNERTRL